MVNLNRAHNLYKFSVNGGDAKATTMGLWIPALMAVVLGSLYGYYGKNWFPPEKAENSPAGQGGGAGWRGGAKRMGKAI